MKPTSFPGRTASRRASAERTRGRPSSQGCAVTKRRNAVCMCMHVAKPTRYPARTRKPAAPVLPEQQQAGRATLPANLPTYFTQSTSPVTVLLLPLPASLSYPIAPDDDDDLDLPNAVATAAPSANHTRLTSPRILHQYQHYHQHHHQQQHPARRHRTHPNQSSPRNLQADAQGLGFQNPSVLIHPPSLRIHLTRLRRGLYHLSPRKLRQQGPREAVPSRMRGSRRSRRRPQEQNRGLGTRFDRLQA